MPAQSIELNQANQIFEEIIYGINFHWKETCDLAELTSTERQQLWGRAVLSPAVINGYALIK